MTVPRGWPLAAVVIVAALTGGCASSPPDPATAAEATSHGHEPPTHKDGSPGVPGAGSSPHAGAGDEGWRPGEFMTQAVALVIRAAQTVEAQTSLGFDGDSACVLGAFLDRGGRIDLTRSFEAGVRYAIIGGGAEGTLDLDLAILAPSGALLTADTEEDATPVLEFTAPEAGRYHVVLSLPGASVDGTFAALAIMKDAGFQVPAGNIGKSFGTTLGAAARASALVSQKWPELKGLAFHARADWSFYGTVLAQGETITFGGLDLDAPATVVMAATDGQSSNIDLTVVESASGTAVAADTDADATPLVIFPPEKGRSYEVRITNVVSGGPSLVTTLVLDAK